MTRRNLVEGLKQFGVADAETASRVIIGEADPSDPSGDPPAERSSQAASAPLLRVPFTSKVRQDIAVALKRASLERQLAGETPYEIQEILEAVLVPWLRGNGYLR